MGINKNEKNIVYTYVNLSKNDLKKIVSAIFSNLTLNIHLSKKKLQNKEFVPTVFQIMHFSVIFQLHPDLGELRVDQNLDVTEILHNSPKSLKL